VQGPHSAIRQGPQWRRAPCPLSAPLTRARALPGPSTTSPPYGQVQGPHSAIRQGRQWRRAPCPLSAPLTRARALPGPSTTTPTETKVSILNLFSNI
jgi:hypothetical protein